MFEKAQSFATQQLPHEWEQRFSVANDQTPDFHRSGRFTAPRGNGGFRRFLLASGVFAFFAAAAGVLTLALPNEISYQARILAVMPQPEELEGSVSASMEEVISYARTLLTADATRASAKTKFGDDRTDLISVTLEHASPVIDIATSLQDPAAAQETVNYFADVLTTAKQAEPGADGARHALEQTLDEAKAALAAFDEEAPGALPEALRLEDSDPAQLRETAEAAHERALAASKLSLNAVLTGKVSQEVMTPTLTALVDQYMQAKADVEVLSDKLGPLHPQFVAAKTYLAAAERRITDEIARIVKTARAETQSAAAEQMQAEKSSSQQASQKAEYDARRADLQAAVDAAQANLEAFDRSLAPVPPARFRMISPATRIETPYVRTDLIILGGLALGFVSALLVFARTRRHMPVENQFRDHFKAEPPVAVNAMNFDMAVDDTVDVLTTRRFENDWRYEARCAANDEEVQTFSPEVRALAMRLAALRKRAEEVAEAESQPSIEEALAEMRRIRSKVRVLSETRNRRA
ncbi:hypothetical protein [Rhizobium sp. L1K21]|uniref:hypothetical protein n=1 Tax=Rhizobium sp. L1K21 TaxID=2954933 RepID=UPI002092CF2C|nr:hypothetical protein [Rhizobium sp. L1K21]MCO6187095.1 hypothetical protein [Rhizobium sp. L1K21]